MKAPLTISAITIVFSINAQQLKKLNDLSDVLVEATSLYVGNNPSSTAYGAISNVAIGQTALSLITTGDFNTAIGHDALFSNNTGEVNTATGYQTLYTNSNGEKNTATGYQTLFSNTTGYQNTASGYHSLNSNTTGSHNTAYGANSLLSKNDGAYNTAYGANSSNNNQTGQFNTTIGYQALSSNTTGSENTALGSSTQTSGLNSKNQTVIGYNATGKEDNSVVLGNSEVTAVYMGDDTGDGNSYAKVYAGDGDFYGQLTISGDVFVNSDARLKANIVSLGATLARLLLIEGKTYTMKKDGKQKIGLLAQDIKNVFPELVSEDDHEMLAVNYQGLIPILINALKEQDAKISRLEQLTKQLITNE